MTTPRPLGDPLDLGGCTIRLVSGGGLKLDGGAMFGIIPRALWGRGTPADEQNRIQLACNCVLVDFAGPGARRVVIELGHGPKFAEKERKIYEIDTAHWLRPNLRAAGIDPQTITDVIPSHLHFDHVGGVTAPADDDPAGPPAPTFPNACVHVQRQEFADARRNFGIMSMTYREENFAPLDATRAWRFIDGEACIIPAAHAGGAYIAALLSPGHTRGHHSLLIQGREQAALFVGDVLPTAAHLGPPYNMGYDQYPHDNRDSKRRILGLAAAHDWLLILGHEPHAPLQRVRRERDWFALTPA